MADDISISTENTGVTVQGKPLVLNERFIDLIAHDGEGKVVIGRVRAEFDFTRVPPELHAFVLTYLMGASQSWYVGSVLRGGPYEVIERREPPRKTPPLPDVREQPWYARWWVALRGK